MTIIYFILLLTIIICLHEAGHLAAAKLFGVYCFEYSFGMGPVLFQKKGRETVYSIRAVPVGGYVALAGETDGDESYPDVEVPPGRRLPDKPVWQRIIIMLAGVTMNFLLAYLIFCMIFLWAGGFQESPTGKIESVMEDSPAERAGLQAGDVITGITLSDGTHFRTETFQDLQIATAMYEEGDLKLEILRGNEQLTVMVTPEYNEEYESVMIGITGGAGNIIRVNFLNCWKYGAVEMKEAAGLMLKTIGRLFRGKGLNQLSGPVGIYSATEQSVSYGFASYLFLIAELSLNIGIINLLPLPVLDGGQILITAAEAAVHRKLNEKLKLGLMAATWLILISLMLFVTWNDISRLIG